MRPFSPSVRASLRPYVLCLSVRASSCPSVSASVRPPFYPSVRLTRYLPLLWLGIGHGGNISFQRSLRGGGGGGGRRAVTPYLAFLAHLNAFLMDVTATYRTQNLPGRRRAFLCVCVCVDVGVTQPSHNGYKETTRGQAGCSAVSLLDRKSIRPPFKSSIRICTIYMPSYLHPSLPSYLLSTHPLPCSLTYFHLFPS